MKRRVKLLTNQIYHVFNRSIAKEEIFFNADHLKQILGLIEFYKYPESIKYSTYKRLSGPSKQNFSANIAESKPLIDIYAFAIMPTHFHFLIRQNVDKGITNFTSNIQNSYAKYFNEKETRDGSLFKKPFKAVNIANDNTFLHVLRYIHLNPVTASLIPFEKLQNYKANSYSAYINGEKNCLINTKPALGLLGSVSKFVNFTKNQSDYQKKLSYIKSLCLE